jgi:hypothetical protein
MPRVRDDCWQISFGGISVREGKSALCAGIRMYEART